MRYETFLEHAMGLVAGERSRPACSGRRIGIVFIGAQRDRRANRWKIGISQPAVHKRKVRILKSLKKLLEN